MNQEAGTKSNRVLEIIIAVVALAMVAYHLVSAHFRLESYNAFQNTHLTFALTLIFLSTLRGARRRWQVVSLIALVLSLIPTGYVHFNVKYLEWHSGLPPTTVVVIMSGILAIVLLEACRRAVGGVLAVVILVFLSYSFLGHYVPGFFHGAYVAPDRIIARVGIGSLGVEGIFSFILAMSADVIFLFVVFGALFQVSGATRFFIQVGKLIGSKLAGGPALTAVVTSALVGMVTGSVAANVATTGAFTIPSMKKMGYKPEQAGAIEAVASTGGQIMPPVMGAVAFIMVAFTGIPYVTIMAVAVLPAILYFLSLGLYVQFHAMKMGLKAPPEEVNFREMLITGPMFVIPLLFLIIFLIKGYPLNYTMSLTIVLLILLSLIRKETRASLGQWVQAFTQGAITGSMVAVTCACLGLMVASISLTGLLLKIPSFVEMAAGGNLILALILAMVASIILGSGVSVAASYVLVAIVVCPVLVNMGLPVIQAHFFNFYYACIAMLTPPVAIGVIIAAQVAEARFLKTALEALKAAAGSFLVPYLFIWSPILLLMPKDPLSGTLGLIASFVIIMSIQVAVCGQYLTSINRLERAVFVVIILLLFTSLFTGNYVIIAAGIALMMIATIWQWRKARAVKHALNG